MPWDSSSLARQMGCHRSVNLNHAPYIKCLVVFGTALDQLVSSLET
jgi:hypothetical protein